MGVLCADRAGRVGQRFLILYGLRAASLGDLQLALSVGLSMRQWLHSAGNTWTLWELPLACDRLATAAAGGRHACRTNAIIPGGGKDNTITRAPGSATAQRLRRLAQPWRRVTS